ncbi:MAG: pyruvate kinase [Desulfofustis sp.]|nr:pyruvate kinase [Desulfofustis sp.]
MYKKNKTKIVATLGPSCNSERSIFELIGAGVDVFRINLSHGDRDAHAKKITNVKRARERAQCSTAILLDTRGPEIRVGELGTGTYLNSGGTLVLSSTPEGADVIPVNYDKLADDVSVGNIILLDDGKIKLQVISLEPPQVTTAILVGGVLISRKRVSLPDIEVSLPSLSEKDKEDIIFGVEQEVDFFAASFVRKPEDVENVRQVIRDCGGSQSIIAKIENRQGVNNLAEILEAADGLMVARGDLGVEMPAEEVPIIQKKIIRAANIAGKPVITATQMLESMISSPTPTRAEASDVTNSIFDGTDAVMLSGETAIGSYPLEAVHFLAKTARISEEALDYETILADGLRHRRPVITDAISYASCATAADLSASAIITSTTSGSTARRVARYRPHTPIIAFSPVPATLRLMQLVRGVIPRPCARPQSIDEQIQDIIQRALEEKLIEVGEKVVITAGLPLHTPGTTNTLKVLLIDESYLKPQVE